MCVSGRQVYCGLVSPPAAPLPVRQGGVYDAEGEPCELDLLAYSDIVVRQRGRKRESEGGRSDIVVRRRERGGGGGARKLGHCGVPVGRKRGEQTQTHPPPPALCCGSAAPRRWTSTGRWPSGTRGGSGG